MVLRLRHSSSPVSWSQLDSLTRVPACSSLAPFLRTVWGSGGRGPELCPKRAGPPRAPRTWPPARRQRAWASSSLANVMRFSSPFAPFLVVGARPGSGTSLGLRCGSHCPAPRRIGHPPNGLDLGYIAEPLSGVAVPKPGALKSGYSPECVEGSFSEVRLQDPACIVSSAFRERRGSVSKH